MFKLEYSVHGRNTLRKLYGPFYFNAPCGSLVPKDSLVGIKFVVFSYRPMRTAFPMYLWLLNMITLTVKNYFSISLSSSNLIIKPFFKIMSIFYFWHESWISYPKHRNKNYQLSAHLKVIVISKFQSRAGKIKWLGGGGGAIIRICVLPLCDFCFIANFSNIRSKAATSTSGLSRHDAW